MEIKQDLSQWAYPKETNVFVHQDWFQQLIEPLLEVYEEQDKKGRTISRRISMPIEVFEKLLYNMPEDGNMKINGNYLISNFVKILTEKRDASNILFVKGKKVNKDTGEDEFETSFLVTEEGNILNESIRMIEKLHIQNIADDIAKPIEDLE
jgi:hypothetical protein